MMSKWMRNRNMLEDFSVKRLLFFGVGTFVLLSALWLETTTAHAQSGFLPALYNGPVGLCRVGINHNNNLNSYPTTPLRLGWHIDYTAIAQSTTGVEYFPVIRLEQTIDGYNYSFRPNRLPANEAELRAKVATLLGHYWIVGNEPDRLHFQDDMEPHMYARAYHDLYHIIKDEDPTAKVVAGAIVQPTEVRLTYLDLVLESYFQNYKAAMPVDAWAFHNFVLNEASCSHYAKLVPPEELGTICWGADIPPGVDAVDGLRIDVQDNDRVDLFQEQVIRFRQWMADRGYRNTPAFLSEFGVLMPPGLFNPDFTPVRVNTFMNETFDFLMNTTDPNIGFPGDNNRLVQRFAWYSVDDKVNHNGFLFDPNLPAAANRTPMGDNFAAYTSAMADNVDYYLEDVTMLGAPPLTSRGATTITLQATVGNSGNLVAGTPATVSFYNGNPNSGGALIATAQSISLPGCGEQGTVQVEWGEVAPGNYTVFARVQTSTGDLDASNNQGSMPVRFADAHLFMPTAKADFLVIE
jgi:hypothetical protein